MILTCHLYTSITKFLGLYLHESFALGVRDAARCLVVPNVKNINNLARVLRRPGLPSRLRRAQAPAAFNMEKTLHFWNGIPAKFAPMQWYSDMCNAIRCTTNERNLI